MFKLSRFSFNGWLCIQVFSFCCVILPLVALLGNLFSSTGKHWQYVSANLLPQYLWETILLTVGSGLFTLVIGISLAWFVSVYDFWGKCFFKVVLIIPLAIPPYIAAYTYEGLLGYTGIIQTTFRHYFDLNLSYLSTAISGQVMAIWIFSITLYPYVYLLSYAFLKNQSASIFENGLILGNGRWRLFFKVGLPLMLPIAGAGTILVCLEVLNDFGVASFYGLNTFTTAIFAAWFGMGDSDTAIKLAIILLSIVLCVLLLRKYLHNARRYHIVSSKEKKLIPHRASLKMQIIMVTLCSLICVAGFGLPFLQMLLWLRLTWHVAFTTELISAITFTLGTAIPATLIILITAIGTINAARVFGGRFSTFLSQGTTLGYAIPSAVLAMGIITLFVIIDKFLHFLLPSIPKMLLSMSSFILIFAYIIRFFTIGYQAVEAGFAKVGMIYTESSRTLGRSVTSTFFLVDLPLIRHALISGTVLIFIDIIKELPLSLLLRPFGAETLGTSVYQFANNEILENTALPSLCIVLIGIVFILFMQFWEKRGYQHVS